MKHEFRIYGVLLLVTGLAIAALRRMSVIEYRLTLGDLLVTVLTFILTMMMAEFINSIILHRNAGLPGSGGPAASRGLRRLIAELKSTDPLTRREAAEQLGGLADELAEAKAALGDLRSDPNPDVQKAVSQALARHAGAEVLDDKGQPARRPS